MNERLKAKMERAASLPGEDGTVTPAATLPSGLLVQEGSGGLELDLQEALIAASVAHALKLAREQTCLTARELAKRRGLSKAMVRAVLGGFEAKI